MRDVRVLTVSGDLLRSRAGGLARYVDGLVRGLSQTNSTQLVGIGKADDPDSAAPAETMTVMRLAAVRARVAARLSRTDVIATHFALYSLSIADILKKRPHVLHFHGPWAMESAAEGAGRLSTWAKRLIERRVYATADRAVTLSKAFAKILIEEYRVPAEIVRVIPGGIDLPSGPMHDRIAARVALGWPTDRPIVLCVRRLARRMGIDVLIDAAAVLRHRHPDALIVIAGKGALAAELQGKIDVEHLANHVRLLGFVPDDQLSLAYAAADLSVVPSQTLEGFGLITIESLLEGTPVLVTPVGGLPEVVDGLDPSLVLSSATAAAIADGLSIAISSLPRLPTRAACRSYVESNFGWPAIANQVLDVYREAIRCSS